MREWRVLVSIWGEGVSARVRLSPGLTRTHLGLEGDNRVNVAAGAHGAGLEEGERVLDAAFVDVEARLHVIKCVTHAVQAGWVGNGGNGGVASVARRRPPPYLPTFPKTTHPAQKSSLKWSSVFSPTNISRASGVKAGFISVTFAHADTDLGLPTVSRGEERGDVVG